VWAEEFGLGEMGLAPDVFWGLLLREFEIKFGAYQREQDRQRSLFLELALMTGQFKDKDRAQLRRSVNALRRYPVKRWLKSP
jgi:hypothetical protein